MKKTLILALACMGLAAPAFADMPKMNDGKWVDDGGYTLYTFDKDTQGKSACNAACAQNWPPAVANADDTASGDWSFVKSADGKNQWAYKGQPLYRFVMDKSPGETKGDGVKGMWHTAKP